MQTILFLGPPGAGKTTLIAETLRAGTLPGRIAYIFNDEGTPTTVDAGGSGEDLFLPLTSGCFGCRDESGLRRVLEETRKGDFSWCVIEPLGFIAGNELPDLLSSLGVATHVITLIDAQNHEDNVGLGIVESQLAAATAAVVITKVHGAPSEAILDLTAQHAPHVPVLALHRDQALPASVIERMHNRVTKRRTLKVRVARCGHGCTHEHHHHEHGHDHSLWTYHAGLVADATLLDVQAVFAGQTDIIRIKGVVEGKQFHRVQLSDWERTAVDTRPPFVTFYSRKPIALESLDDRVLVPAPPKHGEQASTRDLLRRPDIGEDRTTHLLRKLMNRAPKTVVMGRQGPLTNPEALEIINELRKRPGIPPELAKEAIDQRVRYYLSVLDVFTSKSPWWNDPESANRKRMLAVGIGWFAQNRPEALRGETLAAITRVNLDDLLAEGLEGLVAHNSDLQTSIDVAEEVRDTLIFIGKASHRLCTALDAVVRLAEIDPRRDNGLLSAWQQARAASTR